MVQFCLWEHGGSQRLRARKETITERSEPLAVPPAASGGALRGLLEAYGVYNLRVTSYWECFYPHRRRLQQLGRFFLIFANLRRN
jgi:hypothetical protein